MTLRGGLAAFVIYCSLAARPLILDHAISADQSATVSGSVRSLSGVGLPDAHITFKDLWGSSAAQSVTTDDQGRFEIRNIPPGRYAIAATKLGFVRTEYGALRPEGIGTPVLLRAAGRLEVPLTVFPGAVLTGTLRMQDGQSEARARVVALRRNYDPHGVLRVVVAGQAPTDGGGSFRIYGLAPGEYVVAALPSAHPGDVQRAATLFGPTFFPGTDSFERATWVPIDTGQEQVLDFNLASTSTRSVAGLVSGAWSVSGSAHPIFHVTFTRLGDPIDGLVRTTVNAKQDGSFAVVGLPVGRYLVTATATELGLSITPRSWWGQNEVEIVERSEPLHILVAATPAGNVSGEIEFVGATSPNRPSLNAARISLQSADGLSPLPLHWETSADSSGQFKILGIRPGRYLVETHLQDAGAEDWILDAVSGEAGRTNRNMMDVTSGYNAFKLALAQEFAVFSGRIIASDDQPAAGVFALLSSMEPGAGPIAYCVRSAPDGSFLIVGVRPSNYRFTVLREPDADDFYDPSVVRRLALQGVPIAFAPHEDKHQDFRIAVR